MSKSYTPGLKILKNTSIVKDRILPLQGEVLVNKNQEVLSNTVIASTEIPGNVHMINLINELNIDAEQAENCMLLKVGDIVNKDQVIAQNKGLFGMFKSEVKSPIDGIIENISNVTGQLAASTGSTGITIDYDKFYKAWIKKEFKIDDK